MKAIAAVMLMLASVLLSCKGGGSNVNLPKTDSLAILRKLDSIRVEIKASKKHREIKAVVDRKIANGFNGNIIVSQRGVVLFDTCVGYANFEKKIPNTPNSAFQLASLSKTFTSAAVMLLVEKGQLNLNNTVQDYYPEFPYSGVTLRSLLSHRSGLPYYEYVFDVKTRSEKLYPNNQDMMRWFSETKPAPKIHNLPDHYFGYNNTNFAILAAIVEKVSKKDFAHFLEEEIFKPLGMNSSFAATQLNDSLLTKNRTFGYQYNRRIAFDQYDNILGDKGVFSTISDLLKWDRALKSNVLLNKESLREMYTPRSFEHPGLRNYGYGFRLWLNEKQQTDYVYHTGWWKGYNTIMFMDLRDDFVIIVLSNRYNKDVYHIKEIIDIVHGGKKETSVQENILDE